MGTDATTFTVKVKWNKQTFPAVQIDTTEPPELFKSQLWTLTGVPPPRQTILGLKGGKLRDDADWAATGLRNNMTLMLMGTPDAAALAAAPPAQDLPRVVDDLHPDAVATVAALHPAVAAPPGLANLGNTCYMNATVQCLAAVDPLADALAAYAGRPAAPDPAERLLANLRDVVAKLRARPPAAPAVTPLAFLSALRQVSPQFAERASSGFFMQQDAEECWGEILTRLAAALRVQQHPPQQQRQGSETGTGVEAGGAAEGAENVVDALFSMRVRAVDRCGEGEEEEVVERVERMRALKCHISVDVNHLAQGVREGLEETIEKHSDRLGRTAEWKRTGRLETLPPFLIVQFVRFFWKPTEGVKAKILRNVSFPVQLDVFDFCADSLKHALSVKRDQAKAKADAAIGASAAPGAAQGGGGGGGEGGERGGQASATEDTATADASGMTAGNGDSSRKGVVQAETGNYELCAVLTHQGRAADAGHYVAWVKDDGGRWFKFDDDKVTLHTEEEVKKLSGGGDWHMAYMCVYRAKNVA